MDNNVLKALNVIEQVNNVILGKDKQIREIMAHFWPEDIYFGRYSGCW